MRSGEGGPEGHERRLPLRHALALGLLQGPTELLPVSSSAHTELVPWLAGWPYADLDGERRKAFEVALHAGAGLALALHMRRELVHDAVHLDRRRAGVIALSLAPAALAGYALERPIQRWLGGPRSIAAGLAAGAVAMGLCDRRNVPRQTVYSHGQTESSTGHRHRHRHHRHHPHLYSHGKTESFTGPRHRPPGQPPGKRRTAEDANACDGLALGLAQAVALIPGVSRNGATLTAARARGFSRAGAQTLSRHAGLPVLFGAGALKAARLRRSGLAPGERAALAVGGASALASALASARLLDRRLREGQSLWPYSLYRCVLAGAVLARVRGYATRTQT
jgi:undecaprenyl-diphosphatase